MTNIHKLKLIKGEFNPSEANQLLTKIFKDKIQFHEMNNFSFTERFGHEHQIAKKRIPELKESLQQLKEIIDLAKSNNQRLMISSEIKIFLTESN